jgi:hypothetical protein
MTKKFNRTDATPDRPIDVARFSIGARQRYLRQQQAGRPPHHRLRQLREDRRPPDHQRRENLNLHQRVGRNPDALFKVKTRNVNFNPG